VCQDRERALSPARSTFALGLDPADPGLVDSQVVGDLVEEGALHCAGSSDRVREGSLVGEAVEGDPARDRRARGSPGGPWHTLVQPEEEDSRSLLVGPRAVAAIYAPTIFIAAAAGIWLFYVQHQFEGAYWKRGAKWDYVAAALQGSSYYKLPRILQWFSGNIGFHHIHHLSTRVPNYNLQRCHEANPLFQSIKPTTLMASFRAATLRLWDEKAQRLVGFRRLAEIRAEAQEFDRQGLGQTRHDDEGD